MNKTKKWLALALSMVMFISLLASCAKSDKDETAAEPSETADSIEKTEQNTDEKIDGTASDSTPELDFSEHVEFTIWMPPENVEWISNYAEHPGVQYFTSKFNMTLKFEHPPKGSEEEAFNIMIATGELPDVFQTTYFQGSISELFRDGYIADLAPYLDYMPNLRALFDKDPLYRKNALNDDGQMLRFPDFRTDDEDPWGGLVFRKDILDTMTNGNIQFPSGNEVPTTIEDWDYMLPLFKTYFENSGMPEYAVFILPATGTFGFSNILNGFGSNIGYYLKDGKVTFGPLEDGYYNYLVKMREWYEEGYIYKDFASRVNDLFYMPNPSLIYGGGAGIWYGLYSQLGDALSMPEHGLEVEVWAMPDPIDTEHGITSAPNYSINTAHNFYGGFAVSKDTKNVERLMAAFDYFYGEEGCLVRSAGLNAEQVAELNGDSLYHQKGLQDGIYSLDADGNVVFNQVIYSDPDYGRNMNALRPIRMPGILDVKINPFYDEANEIHFKRWTTYSAKDYMLPVQLHRTEEEDAIYLENQTAIEEYINTMVVRFIMGEEELNEETWEAFKKQLEDYGVYENIAIVQASYERFLAR